VQSTGAGALFQTGDRCIACHSNLAAPSGEDVSIGYAWRASIMANSSRDPYWQAAVRRELLDHPNAGPLIEDTCATCHMPMARVTAATQGKRARVFAEGGHGTRENAAAAPLAHDGVSCSICHQIRDDNFGTEASFTGGFVIDRDATTGRSIFGPFAVDPGRQSVMHSATQFIPTEARHIQQSELCATCHTLYTHPLNAEGREEAERFPEQVPYLEWRHSEYRSTQSCQSCHMPQVAADTPISSVLGQPRTGLSRHSFEGGNAFMLRLLNKYRADLGVAALPAELDVAAQRTVEFLSSQSARVAIDSARVSASGLEVHVSIENLSGHKLPTAYPSRRAWIHLSVRDARGELVFESGKLQPDGSIVGNDNDADPHRFEPHYERISDASQVQIYESVIANRAGQVTTGLLQAVRYIKDNRLLPKGFEKATASADIAVRGEAMQDADFAGGQDQLRYVIPLSGATAPFSISAELWFQPIGYRWAHNLKAYDAFETRRFVTYYESMATESAALLTSATLTVRP
jgi:hypothetical protein